MLALERTGLAIALSVCAACSGGEGTMDVEASSGERTVFVNRVRMDTARLEAMETRFQTRIQNGRYWYDAACGAWGVEDGPTAGFLTAGLEFPGPMPDGISGGGTGIWINGREIHTLDQAALHQIFGMTIPGRYWMDAMGNFGQEGGPPIANFAAAIQASLARQGGSTTHGYDSVSGARGTVASDGAGGMMYSGRTATGKSVFWSN